MSVARWLGRGGLLVGGLAAGVVLADCGARAIAPHGAADLVFGAPDNAPQGMYITDPDLVYRARPGFSGVNRSLGYAVTVRFNEHGLRGPALGPKEQSRWLAAGDSFTLSPQVTEEDTFSARLGSALGVQVLNAGVDGYSTWQAALRYEELDDALQLDGVLLTFFLGNDFEDNQRFAHMQREARGRPVGQPIQRQPQPPLQAFLRQRSFLYGLWWVSRRVAALEDPKNPERNRWRRELALFTRDGQSQRGQARGQTERALRALQQAVTQRGDQLHVAIAPPAFVVDTARVEPTFSLVGLDPATATLDAPAALLDEVLRVLGVPGCDLSGPLRQAGSPSGLYFTYDGHWTPRGHAVVAQALASCMAPQVQAAGPSR